MLQPNLLIVETDDEYRFELEPKLSDEGFRLFQTSDGDAIFDTIKKNEVSLMLLGPAIAAGDRIDLCRRIKGNEETRGVAVVFATVEGEFAGMEGLSPGADDYVTKPYNSSELLAKLRSLYKIHEYQIKLESLVEFARGINRLKYKEIRETLQEWMERILPADRFSVFVYSEKRDSLIMLAKTGGSADLEGLTIRAEESPIMNDALKTGETKLVTDFQGSEFYTGHGRKYSDGYALCLPLKIGNEIMGAMNLSGESKGFFSNLDLSYVSLISEVIAASLQNASMHKEQKRLAITDGLTGLTNRRRFQELLLHNFARAARYKLKLSCILCDIDHFKKVNDDYGHLSGDAILQEIAVRMKRHLREVDTIARYGGEEFVMLLPETDRDGAKIVAERIREDVAGSKFMIPGGSINVSISLGICDNSQEDTLTGEALVDYADQALYLAKERGRNQTVIMEKDEME